MKIEASVKITRVDNGYILEWEKERELSMNPLGGTIGLEKPTSGTEIYPSKKAAFEAAKKRI